MQNVFFSSYKELARFPKVGQVAAIENSANYYNLRRFVPAKSQSLEYAYRKMAAVTGSWRYYQKVLELQAPDLLAARKEILEKYPYDGKSTFKELLSRAVKEN